MTNCTCGNPLREGESECDICLVKRHKIRFIYDDIYLEQLTIKDVAQALRRAEFHNEPHEFRYDEDGNLIEEEAGDDSG